MVIRNIPEPVLLFGRGRSICPKSGIKTFLPYDIDIVRPRYINLAIIGKSESIEKVQSWLSICKGEVSSGKRRLFNLFPNFMGFNPEKAFQSELVSDPSYIRKINNSDFEDVFKNSANPEQIVELIVDLYLAELRYLSKNKNPHVVICAIPEKFSNIIMGDGLRTTEDEEISTNEDNDTTNTREQNFRRLLKAKAMEHGIPIQIVRDRIGNINSREMQDPATVAWNFFTALYYKNVFGN